MTWSEEGRVKFPRKGEGLQQEEECPVKEAGQDQIGSGRGNSLIEDEGEPGERVFKELRKTKGTEVEEERAVKGYLSKVMKELEHHVKVSGCPCDQWDLPARFEAEPCHEQTCSSEGLLLSQGQEGHVKVNIRNPETSVDSPRAGHPGAGLKMRILK